MNGATLRCVVRAQCWAKPYEEKIPGIISVLTGLDKQFRYSPIFENCLADTMVELTGYRRKDYVIAEKQTGVKHIPCKTVWHHVWEEKDGKYRMQLVDFKEHQRTIPHAGGCKLWILKTKIKKRYVRFHNGDEEDYSDIPMFYPIDNRCSFLIRGGYVSRRTVAKIKRKHAKLIGVDMYGNLFYENGKRKYFWDHEEDLLIPLPI